MKDITIDFIIVLEMYIYLNKTGRFHFTFFLFSLFWDLSAIKLIFLFLLPKDDVDHLPPHSKIYFSDLRENIINFSLLFSYQCPFNMHTILWEILLLLAYLKFFSYIKFIYFFTTLTKWFPFLCFSSSSFLLISFLKYIVYFYIYFPLSQCFFL